MKKSTVLITGGNAGIGKATAEQLLNKGFRVIIAGRNAMKLKAATESLAHNTGEKVDWILCDLSSLESVKNAADEFLERYEQLDVLINNAGIFGNYLEFSKDGFEKQFATNHLGPFLLTKRLLPLLQKAKEPRIINVSSAAHYKARIDFDSFRGPEKAEDYNGLKAYAQSKLANVLFTKELARRYPNILSNCLHPGVVRTQIGNKSTKWYYSLFWSMYKPFAISQHTGAKTSVYLAASCELRDVKGRYFDQNQCCKKPARLARDEQLAAQLWNLSEEFVAEFA